MNKTVWKLHKGSNENDEKIISFFFFSFVQKAFDALQRREKTLIKKSSIFFSLSFCFIFFPQFFYAANFTCDFVPLQMNLLEQCFVGCHKSFHAFSYYMEKAEKGVETKFSSSPSLLCSK
jgi:hypothetical protein